MEVRSVALGAASGVAASRDLPYGCQCHFASERAHAHSLIAAVAYFRAHTSSFLQIALFPLGRPTLPLSRHDASSCDLVGGREDRIMMSVPIWRQGSYSLVRSKSACLLLLLHSTVLPGWSTMSLQTAHPRSSLAPLTPPRPPPCDAHPYPRSPVPSLFPPSRY